MKYSKSEEEFLSWEELTSETSLNIYMLAFKHFSYRYLTNLTRSGDLCSWGNEVESIILKKNNKNIYTISTDHHYDQIAHLSGRLTLMPEFARFILEFIPDAPFNEGLRDVYHKCNEYMEDVIELINAAELKGFTILLGTCHPLFGQDFLMDMNTINSQTSDQLEQLKSNMLEYITKSGRYRTLISNILLRKGCIPWTAVSSCGSEDTYYLPGPLFGMGLCGMHVTIQSATMEESCFLHDAFQPLCPLLLALSASTSVMAGLILNKDTRTSYLSESMDDRAQADCCQKWPKRYGITGVYIAKHPANIPLLNDLSCYLPKIDNIDSILQSIDDDFKLSDYVKSIFAHYPLVILRNTLTAHDIDTIPDLWDQLHSLVWPSCRWKLPPLDSVQTTVGWRTEIRCMEMQFSIAENIAYALFVFLLSNAIRDMGLLFYIPQSFIYTDMLLAGERDAIRSEMFWARDIFLDLHFEDASESNSQLTPSNTLSKRCKSVAIETFSSQIQLALENRKVFASLTGSNNAIEDGYTWCPKGSCAQCTCFENSIFDFHLIKLTIKEFMCGSARYPGLLPVLTLYVNMYFDNIINSVPQADISYIRSVISYLADRANGSIPTCATAVRNLVEDIYTHRNNTSTGLYSNKLSEEESQLIVEYMLGARELSLDKLQEYYAFHATNLDTKINIPE